MRNLKKKWILICGCVLVVLAAGLGIWYLAGRNAAEPVNTYPFSYLGMTEYWGDSKESYGPVTTDKIQTIYLSDTQTVTEILVSQGDTVKKGDLLMTFDTTLSDLALERERLKVEKLKLQLDDAQAQLKRIKAMKPMVIPTTTEPEEGEEDQGSLLRGNYELSTAVEYDGSSKEKALICWISSSAVIDDSLLEAIRQKAQEYQQENAQAGADEAQPADEGAEESTEPETQPELTVTSYYVIFKVTKNDRSLGANQVWQGMKVYKNAGVFSMKFFDASEIADHMAEESGGAADKPQIDFGSGYTAAQIAEMRSAQEKTIKDLQFQIRMAEAEYKIKLTEANDGKIYAQIDGEVVSLLSEEEARDSGQPLIKVSGGGGFYVEGTVSELDKDQLKIGQEVTINDWNTGMTYTGTVQSVGDFPASNSYWSGMGNPNVSYYPFLVYVDEEADLQAGFYVSMVYSSADAQTGIYLENPFIRTENGQSYVYVLGQNGKLEKRMVVTGKSLWGSYTEILDGITADDCIAFPYGKNVKAGAPAVACDDLSQLYN